MATQAELDRLRAAINSGRLEVRYGDNVVKYRSLEEMKAIERDLLIELGQQKRGWSFDVIRHSKGIQ